MEGFNSVFASAIDDENTYDSIFGDDTEDILINIVASRELYNESGDEIEFPDMKDDDDEEGEESPEDCDDDDDDDDYDPDFDFGASTDNLGDEDNISTSSDLELKHFGDPDEEDDIDIDPSTDNDVSKATTTSELDRVILFDGGDVGDTGEEQYEDEECKKESALLEASKKKFANMRTTDLDSVINGTSSIKSSKLEAPDEDLIDDVESDDIDSVGESINIFI